MRVVNVNDFSFILFYRYFSTSYGEMSMLTADTICQTYRMLVSCSYPWGEFFQKLKQVFFLLLLTVLFVLERVAVFMGVSGNLFTVKFLLIDYI